MSGMKEKLYKIIDSNKDELFSILSDLVKINSENFGSYGNEKECAEFIGKFFDSLGYKGEVYSPLDIENLKNHPDYLDGRNLEDRRNCSVYIPGKKSDKKLMIASHIDTVEIGEISNWEFSPLCGEIKDGNIYGRGACDDKYGLAISMFLIKKLKELDIQLDFDLIFSAYCDEEYGGSNGALAACLKYPCDDCLSVDCREYELWDSGCGGGVYRFYVSNNGATDTCKNVVLGMQYLLDKLFVFEERRRNELNAIPSFTGSAAAQRPMRIMDYSVGEKGGVNMDKGQFSITLYTDRTEKEIIKELEEIFASVKEKFDELGLNPPSYERTTRFFHYVKSEGETSTIKLITKLGIENDMPFKTCGACLSDLPMFKIYGTKRAIALGIGAPFTRKGGSHQANEYVECDKVVKLAKVIAGFLSEYGKEGI